MLYALSVPLMDVYSAAEAPASGGPFMCLACRSRVYWRHSPHQRPHWAHWRAHNGICNLRRGAVSSSAQLHKRFADEINAYKGSRHHANT